MKKNMLTFEGKDGKTYYVKERTNHQIFRFLELYINIPYSRFEYIPNTQEISKMNGNIYAKFKVKGTDDITELCVADYYDYIKEINFDN